MADEYSNEYPLDAALGNEDPLFMGGSQASGPVANLSAIASSYRSGAITAREAQSLLSGSTTISLAVTQSALADGRQARLGAAPKPYTTKEPYRFSFRNYANINAPVRLFATGESALSGHVVLPVPPETFKWSSSNGIQEITAVSGLSFIHGGAFPLEEITMEGFFPHLSPQQSKPDYIPFDTYKQNFYNAPVLRNKFIALMNSAQPFRFTVSDPSSDSAIFPATPMIVTSFEYEYRFGHGRDIFWSMTLKKWNPQRLISATAVPTTTTGGTTGGNTGTGGTGGNTGGGVGTVDPGTKPPVSTTERPGNPPDTSKYIIKKGDTLWGIADRFLGNGTKWPTIYDLNKKVLNDALKSRGQSLNNPHLIYPGTILQIPKK